MTRSPVRWRDLGAILIFAALAGAFLSIKVLGAPPAPIAPASADLLTYYYPTLQYGFAQMRAGALPLWNPRQSCGTPLFAVPQIGFFYPLYLPFLLVSADHAVTIDIFLHLCLASLGMYWLCRRFGLGWPASIAAGVIFAYQGTLLVKLNFPNFLAPSAWIPIIFLLVDRVIFTRRWRECGLLAAAVGASLLGSLLQFHYYIALALCPFVACRLATLARGRGLGAAARAAGRLLIAAAFGLAVALVRIVPNAHYMSESWRPPGSLSLEDASLMSMPPDAFVENLLTPLPARVPRKPWSPITVRRQAYVGTLSLVLALIGLVAWRPRSVAWPIAAAGLAAVLYSFGTAGGVFTLLYQTPAGSWFRGLERALIVFGFALALLAGAGCDVLLRTGAGRQDSPRWAVVLLLSLSVVIVVLAGWYLAPPRALTLLVAYGVLGWAVLAALLAVRRPGLRAVAGLAVGGVLVADLFYAYTYAGALPQTLREYWSRDEDFFAAIRERQGFDRTYIWSTFSPSALYFYSDLAKAGMNHGVWMCTDYDAVGRRRFAEFLAALNSADPVTAGLGTAAGPMVSRGYARFPLDEPRHPLLDLMGIRFLLLPQAAAGNALPGIREMVNRSTPIMERDGIVLLEYSGALPRAFVVHRVEIEPDDTRLLERLKSEDLRTTALIERDPDHALPADDGGTRPEGTAEIVGYAPDRVDIAVESRAAGFLVLSDQYDDGWHATVRGAPTPIYRTDYLFRGVFVPAGRSMVTFVYRPRSFQVGLAGTLFGAAGILVLLAPRRRPGPVDLRPGAESAPAA